MQGVLDCDCGILYGSINWEQPCSFPAFTLENLQYVDELMKRNGERQGEMCDAAACLVNTVASVTGKHCCGQQRYEEKMPQKVSTN